MIILLCLEQQQDTCLTLKTSLDLLVHYDFRYRLCCYAASSKLLVTGTGVLGEETTRFKRAVWRRSSNTLADLP